MPVTTVAVTEYTDPGCIWSWSSEPQLRWLRHHYGDQLAWRRVLGVQLDDSGGREAESFLVEWRRVADTSRAPTPRRLAWAHASTRPACTAVHAARVQGVEEPVLRRLREAFFVAGRPADTPSRIAQALGGLDELDLDALLGALDEPAVLGAVAADHAETRNPHPAVIGRTGPGPNPGAARPDGNRLRYGFPTLIVRGPEGEQVLSGWLGTDELEAAVIAAGARPADAEPMDPDAALDRYVTLTDVELDRLTGGVPPTVAVRVETATGAIWAQPGEADRLASGVDEVLARSASRLAHR